MFVQSNGQTRQYRKTIKSPSNYTRKKTNPRICSHMHGRWRCKDEDRDLCVPWSRLGHKEGVVTPTKLNIGTASNLKRLATFVFVICLHRHPIPPAYTYVFDQSIFLKMKEGSRVWYSGFTCCCKQPGDRDVGTAGHTNSDFFFSRLELLYRAYILPQFLKDFTLNFAWKFMYFNALSTFKLQFWEEKFINKTCIK